MQWYQAERVKAENGLGCITRFLLFGHVCIMHNARTPELELKLKTSHV